MVGIDGKRWVVLPTISQHKPNLSLCGWQQQRWPNIVFTLGTVKYNRNRTGEQQIGKHSADRLAGWILAISDVNANYKPPFATSSSTLVAALLRSQKIAAQKKKLHQRNMLIVELPECDVLTGSLIPGGICEPAAHYRDEASTTGSYDGL
ncbi:hypothetical protein AVEN_96047-1 [Araneus ventricosus]|uniref:Uncharacterized protein n=1 Tax=Araneus ventricosus TaxID=182803 RepID=A0A4Y2B6X8_ARAVE|nr:hypothetical protein AVEN_96047-1 [Araneus ventricosus]